MSSFKKIWIWGQIISVVTSLVCGTVNIASGMICIIDQNKVAIVLSWEWYQKICHLISETSPILATHMSDIAVMQRFIFVESIVMSAANFYLAWYIWQRFRHTNFVSRIFL